jgi:hypothetical protein
LDGVISVHELHVWQLSDTKLIASLHVLLRSRECYMLLGFEIRKLLHGYGIHSATIQPEFIKDLLDEKQQFNHDNEDEDEATTTTTTTTKVILHTDNISPISSTMTNNADNTNNDNSNEVITYNLQPCIKNY